MTIRAILFDAYGTLFDVHSVIAACERAVPTRGAELSQRWRGKQLEYSWLRGLGERYTPFWNVTPSISPAMRCKSRWQPTLVNPCSRRISR
jgi:2-haloacid dehalogenase